MSEKLQEQYDKIYKYCYFKVKNEHVAEDLTQETFLKYFEQNTYINKGKLLAYLYTIAKNKCIDYYKKTNHIELNENLISKDDLDGKLINLALKQAIQRLPDELIEIIFLRFSNELAINEIALFLEISRFAVNRKLKKALKLLKSELREEDFYE